MVSPCGEFNTGGDCDGSVANMPSKGGFIYKCFRNKGDLDRWAVTGGPTTY